MSTSEHDSDDAPTIGTFPFPAQDIFHPNINYNQQINQSIMPQNSPSTNIQLFSTMLSTPTASMDPCLDITMSPMNFNTNHYSLSSISVSICITNCYTIKNTCFSNKMKMKMSFSLIIIHLMQIFWKMMIYNIGLCLHTRLHQI